MPFFLLYKVRELGYVLDEAGRLLSYFVFTFISGGLGFGWYQKGLCTLTIYYFNDRQTKLSNGLC